ncbi:methyltransferase domain-containing protein [Roseixanthobacter glucoisosaccharinicivorans]|uniref:methyltransferase domain-containing protein n=1 Tax=Roseixanthobacter glucoisosaccharinicivorans TaxID=3119923 RepID=UPI00372B503F
MSEALLSEIQCVLLRGRTWRYLRYLHFRDLILRIGSEIETICVCGGGHGYAELAIAIEFPHLKIVLTDIIAKGYPNYHKTMDLCFKNSIDNLNFSIWNVLTPAKRKFDLVCSTEMLEHVPDAPRAVTNMRNASSNYVYCLVPYSDDETNNTASKRIAAWDKCEHFVCGYDEKSLASMFGTPIWTAGTYWRETGFRLRERLMTASDAEITAEMETLKREALEDICDKVPVNSREAFGIKTLTRWDAPRPAKPLLPPALDLFMPKAELATT